MPYLYLHVSSFCCYSSVTEDSTDAVNSNLFTVNIHKLSLPSPPLPSHSGVMNNSSDEEEDGGHTADSTSPTSTSAGQRQAAAVSEQAQLDPQWYSSTVDLSGEGQDTAYNSVDEEGVRPHHHSSGWSQGSTALNTTDIDPAPLSSLSRRSLH